MINRIYGIDLSLWSIDNYVYVPGEKAFTGSGLSLFANSHAFGFSCGLPISPRTLSNFSFDF